MEVFHEISKPCSSSSGSFARGPAAVLRLQRGPEFLLPACYGFLDVYVEQVLGMVQRSTNSTYPVFVEVGNTVWPPGQLPV